MTFGHPDPNITDEEALIDNLRTMMYPHGIPRARTGAPGTLSNLSTILVSGGAPSAAAGAATATATTGASSPASEAASEGERPQGLEYTDTWSQPARSTGTAGAPSPSVAGTPSTVPPTVSAPGTSASSLAAADAPTTVSASAWAPEWDPSRPWIAPESDSPTWYVVTVGRRVGVFDKT